MGALGSVFLTLAVPLLGVLSLAFGPQLRFKRGERVLTISPDGIHVALGSRSKQMRWKRVSEVSEWERHVRIASKSIHAFVIPFEAFASEGERSDFVARCRNWLR